MAVNAGPDRGRSGVRGEDDRQRVQRFERVCSGDREALDELVAELTPLLWSVARGQGLDRESAADAVQNTWASLLGQLDAIRSPASLVGWLVTTTRRNAWKARTERGREAVLDSEDLTTASDASGRPGEQSGPEAAVLDTDRSARLWRHVRKLPLRCQQLLRIVAFADRPDYAAVSEALGMPQGSIGPTRGRCLAKLRNLLAADPSWSD